MEILAEYKHLLFSLYVRSGKNVIDVKEEKFYGREILRKRNHRGKSSRSFAVSNMTQQNILELKRGNSFTGNAN